MLSILLFNWAGYRLFSAYRESMETTRLQASLDNDRYDAGQLVLLRVSASILPYTNASDRFERAAGAIEIGHLHYRYVAKRVYNDSLEFLCIPDSAANRLRTATGDFFSLVNDLQKTGHAKIPGPSGKIARGLHKIFYLQVSSPRLQRLAVARITEGLLPPVPLSAGHPPIGKQPPRSLA